MVITEVPLSDPTLSGQHRNLVQQILRSGDILLHMIGLVRLYVRIIRQRGFRVVAVADGREAVDTVRTGDQLDMILMHGQLPVKDGYQASREIRASTVPAIAHIKIVALTVSAFEGDRDRCLAAGMERTGVL